MKGAIACFTDRSLIRLLFRSPIFFDYREMNTCNAINNGVALRNAPRKHPHALDPYTFPCRPSIAFFNAQTLLIDCRRCEGPEYSGNAIFFVAPSAGCRVRIGCCSIGRSVHIVRSRYCRYLHISFAIDERNRVAVNMHIHEPSIRPPIVQRGRPPARAVMDSRRPACASEHLRKSRG